MKKLFLYFAFFILLLFPIKVNALREGITNYYIDATVLNNGDMYVSELFVLNGEFNGFERIINFVNPYAPIFNGSVDSFKGSDIYNADGIELVSIKNIDVDGNLNFEYLYHEGDEFKLVSSANIGDYRRYTIEDRYNGKAYKIFNPSNGKKRGFYIEYILKNVAISHSDVAEIGWNLFSDELNEYVHNLEMIINIPNNQNQLRIWGHGPLNGETDIIRDNQIKYTIKDLNPNTAIDFRIVFDKDVIETSKTTNIVALDKILEVETKLAEEANLERERAQKIIENEKKVGRVLNVLNIIWLMLLAYIIFVVYNKYDKEYASTFKTKYFRDFPTSYGPEIVGYLFRKRINNSDLSSSILNLIAKKVIKFEEVKKKDYLLKYDSDEASKQDLSSAEKHLIKWLFEEIGKDETVTMGDIKKEAQKRYNDFLDSFNSWKTLAKDEALKEDFFESHTGVKILGSLYSILGLFLVFMAFAFPTMSLINIVVFIAGFMSLIYFVSITKRTKKGNEDYTRWKGLKNFLKDFGKFESRDLPHIHLWEKYLVYAVVFGCANRLAKTMQIKFTEMSSAGYTPMDAMFDIHYMNMLTNFNRSLNSSVSGAVSTALSTKSIAESRSSSSGGFGGGFSGGGGSFGGGGGGGRF